MHFNFYEISLNIQNIPPKLKYSVVYNLTNFPPILIKFVSKFIVCKGLYFKAHYTF